MKVYLKVFLLLSLIAFSQCANMRRQKLQASPLEKLLQVSQKTNFSKNLYLTINLSLQSGGKVSEVIDFVNQAKNEAATERNQITEEFRAEEEKLVSQISSAKEELDELNSQHEVLVETIEELTQETVGLQARLQRQNEEQQVIIERERIVTEAYTKDQEAYEQRKIRDRNTISALEDIIPALKGLREQGNAFLQKSETQILSALQRIPSNDPIRILTQLSTKFDEEKLNEVIYKLVAILESVQRSQEADKVAQQRADQRYQAFQNEISGLIQAKTNQINQTKTDLNAKEQSLRHNKSLQNSLVQNIEQLSNVLSATQQIYTQAQAVYESHYEQLTQSIESLKEALNILTENEATLESQEQQSVADLE